MCNNIINDDERCDAKWHLSPYPYDVSMINKVALFFVVEEKSLYIIVVASLLLFLLLEETCVNNK